MNKKEIDPRELADPANRNGHAPYPEVIIVSSPRSGLNLIRHVVEDMSGRRTPGKVHIHQKGTLVFHRTHSANPLKTSPGRAKIFNDKGKTPYKKLILLLRDPRESFVRSYNKDFKKFNEYCENINAYKMFLGEKKIIYYDELMSDDSSFRTVFGMLNLLNTFDINAIPKARLESVKWYEKFQAKGGGSKTKGEIALLKHHQKELDTSELNRLWSLLESNVGDMENYFRLWSGSTNWLD